MAEHRFSFRSVIRFTHIYQAMVRGDPVIRLAPQLLGLNPQTCIARLRDGKQALASNMLNLPDLDTSLLIQVWSNYQIREEDNAVVVSRRDHTTTHLLPQDQLLTIDNPTEAEYLALCLLRHNGRLPAPIHLTNINHALIQIDTSTDTIMQEQPDKSYYLF